MTEISFYFNVASRTAYACRLLRRAHRQGLAVAVAGPAEALDEIDRELWSFAAPEFLPHHRIERAAEVPQPLHATTMANTKPQRRIGAIPFSEPPPGGLNQAASHRDTGP